MYMKKPEEYTLKTHRFLRPAGIASRTRTAGRGGGGNICPLLSLEPSKGRTGTREVAIERSYQDDSNQYLIFF